MPCRSSCAIFRVVREEVHIDNAKGFQHFCGNGIIPSIGRKTEHQIRIHRISACILQMVGLNFRMQPDASPLLAKIEQGTQPSRRWHRGQHGLPQSHRVLEKTSPVRHSEWTRTRTGSGPFMSPSVMATWSNPVLASWKTWIRKSPRPVGRKASLGTSSLGTMFMISPQ